MRCVAVILAVFGMSGFGLNCWATDWLAGTWQCTFRAELSQEIQEATGPGGMAYGPKRQFFQALGKTGVNADGPAGKTDSYRETIEQSVEGQVRLHSVYDGGPDGIQIAGWNNWRW